MAAEAASNKTYFFVYLALMALLILTWALSHIHLGDWSLMIALAIATAKMLLVVLYFMHIRYDKGMVLVFASVGLFWLSILMGLTMTDYLTRGHFTG